jgi:hypothetical protein
LLKDCARDIDLKVIDTSLPTAQLNSSEDKSDAFTSMKVKMKGLEGEREISMNTSALENKLNAL